MCQWASCFNPYFTGCSTSTVYTFSRPISQVRVSILILLDVLLQPSFMFILLYSKTSFNPYFTGCSTSTVEGKEIHKKVKTFQSLFYWMFYFNTGHWVAKQGYKELVSILILLDVLLQLQRQVLSLLKKVSFNPYFTGCSTSTRPLMAKYKEEYLFQSLFYWMFYFNGSMTGNRAWNTSSFNPYFTGCSTSTIAHQAGNSWRLGFQSLFYWMFYFNTNYMQ